MTDWDADVIVVGYGGAGAMAALAAESAGAKVLLLEKMEQGGGSTYEAGGSLRPPQDPELAARHYTALSFGTTPLEVMRTLAQGETELAPELERLGGQVVPIDVSPLPFPLRRMHSAYPNVEGSEGLGLRQRIRPKPGEGGGEALWNLLAANIAQRPNIQVGLGLGGVRLYRNSTGTGDRVDAIEVVNRSGQKQRFTARRGIVLTCGGFAWNRTMTSDYLGSDIASLSPPGRATGDGIKMAVAVGADLWHMNAIAVAFGYRFPGHESAFKAQIPATGYLIVDKNGQRYFDESSVDTHAALNGMSTFNGRTGIQERVPSYAIFDERTRQSGPVFDNGTGYNRHFVWSKDNSEEIERGWIANSATARGLAEKLGIPGDALEKTVSEFNRGVDSGRDAFGRPAEQLASISQPFYGIPLWPALLNTQGGPVRNSLGQITDPFGDAVPGLYSAGEIGSVWGRLYPGSGNVSEAMVFGRISGRNAYQLGGDS